MEFERRIQINCKPLEVFNFLRDKHLYPQKSSSPVLVLDKTTPGPVDEGTRYYEEVRMFPWLKGAIWSEITRFEPPRFLEERFWGTGMRGHVAYEIKPHTVGTLLIQRETLKLVGLLRLMDPIVKRLLLSNVEKRLIMIREVLEVEAGRI
jgi:hypothetical protein